MLRQEPYVRVLIEDLDRIVYVCDEEGNASYVFDSEITEQLGITPPELDAMTKNQRNALLRVTPSAGRRIIQSPQWRSVMSTALREDFSDAKSDEPIPVEPLSEFSEKGELIEYTKFEAAVRAVYDIAGSPESVAKWYKSEYKNHKGRPSNPNATYKNTGWNGYSELIGNKVEEFLEFADFKTAVREVYEAAESPDSVSGWYQSEYKKHKGWPSNPQRVYRNTGWKGYSGLVGNEVVEFLDFSEFETKVREAHKAAESPPDVHKWYQSEYRKHKGWPSNPNIKYRDTGWKSFLELVANEVNEIMKYPDFSKFETEVREEYEATGSYSDVRKWYRSQYKKHQGWPSAPNVAYEKTGWKSFPELVGNEKMVPLIFTDFKTAVRAAYKGAGFPKSLKGWYQSEYKKHKGWPSHPDEIYIDVGWKGYSELVGKVKAD